MAGKINYNLRVKVRLFYLSIAILSVIVGMASRAKLFPKWVHMYAGDSIWAFLIYQLFGAMFPQKSPFYRAALALIYTFLTEFSQLYQAPWINKIRASTLGALVLGKGFLWTDLAMYTVGILIALIVELKFYKKFNT